MSCLNCQAETTNPRFCSRSCAATVNNKIYIKSKPKHNCIVCNIPVSARKKYCTECKKQKLEALDKTLQEVTYNDHHRSSAYALIRSRARSIFNRSDKKCTVCNYSKHVEVAHIKAISTFPLETRISVINSKANLILLCPNHHWEFDHNLLSEGDLEKIC